jgi:hypothetical protein
MRTSIPGRASTEAGQHRGRVHAGQAATEDIPDGGRLDHLGRAERIARARAEDQQVPGRDAVLG